MPKEDGCNAYAIACSKGTTNSIYATFTLPQLCKTPYPDDFINFYLSMGGHEAGVSFSQKYKGWNAFYNENGTQINKIITVQPNIPIKMTLKRTAHGIVDFNINGISRKSKGRLKNTETARAVTAARWHSKKCPAEHSQAIWTNISTSGGIQQAAHYSGGETSSGPLLSSLLGNASLPCDESQFDLR